VDGTARAHLLRTGRFHSSAPCRARWGEWGYYDTWHRHGMPH